MRMELYACIACDLFIFKDPYHAGGQVKDSAVEIGVETPPVTLLSFPQIH